MTILTNSGPHTLTFTWNVSGTPTDVGAVTVGIVDANGDTVVASGAATTNNNDGTYTYSLASQTEVNILTATWTRSDTSASIDTKLRVDSSRLFTEAEARSRTITGLATPMSDSDEYSDAYLAEWHDRIARKFESKTGRSWIGRYARVETRGTGTYGLDLSGGVCRESNGQPIWGPGRGRDIAQILSVTVGGTAKTPSDYTIDGSVLYSTTGTWTQPTISDPLNVVVEYQYGLEDEPEANEAALAVLFADAIPSDISSGAVSWSNEDGSFSRDRFGYAYPAKVYEFLKRNPPKPFA